MNYTRDFVRPKGSKIQIEIKDCLDEIHEVTVKYGSTHIVVIGGNLNASLQRDTPILTVY